MTTDTITCPKCGVQVLVIQYGGGFVAAHCGNIIYNSQDRPRPERVNSEKVV